MEPAIPFQLDDSHNRFTKDAAVHFGSSQFAIDKDDRNLGYFESAFISSEFHLSVAADRLQLRCIFCIYLRN